MGRVLMMILRLLESAGSASLPLRLKVWLWLSSKNVMGPAGMASGFTPGSTFTTTVVLAEEAPAESKTLTVICAKFWPYALLGAV